LRLKELRNDVPGTTTEQALVRPYRLRERSRFCRLRRWSRFSRGAGDWVARFSMPGWYHTSSGPRGPSKFPMFPHTGAKKSHGIASYLKSAKFTLSVA
jgi:hypothetical protein